MPREGRWGEISIAALVIAVVAMLIVPLPRPVLDVLLALNIGIAVALLMAAVFTPRPLSFASFPTLLVVTTLFRVGLEVSATRLILRDADAGEVVRAFGSSVVGSSLVVGLVVFAVITIVQLVVVARGAERVAEVSARFALDAMPGKQMAIDADVRAGTLDAAGARDRRAALESESQLYGAMDGAMRFVKGDAIAAIVIVLINLIGGLVIGVGQRGLSARDAVQTYSLLSIGGGLVAQIPSLLVAVASGLLVTRVAASGDRALGADLPQQLGGQPRVLAATAVLLIALGLVPGLPLVPFAVLGLAAAALAVLAFRAAPTVVVSADEVGAASVRGPRLALRFASLPTGAADAPSSPLAALHSQLAAIRSSLSSSTGIAIPPFALAKDTSLAKGEVVLLLDATPVAWFAAAELDAKLPASLATLLPDLVGIDRVASLVESAAATSPVLVRELVPRVVSLPVLAEVVRGLVRENVPVTDLAAILEAISIAPLPTGGFTVKDASALVETLRGSLRRQISARWAPRGQLAVYTVDGMIEDALRSAVDRRDGMPVLALEPAIAQDIVAAVKSAVGKDASPVILASGDVRRHLRSLLEPEMPAVAVLAAHELAPGTSIRTAGRIAV
ncbi:MAG TPA: flagellar biosynthesis protein FlhA [Kofleriaceae bacterium]|jgi:type III secretion protein V